MAQTDPNLGAGAGTSFPDTHWSVILTAHGESSKRVTDALEHLCNAYWHPIYSFVRRSGKSPEDAQDLTQGFFARLIEKDYLSQVDRERGRFRSFLLASLKHFMADDWDRRSALKRGGGQETLSLDPLDAEDRYNLVCTANDTPERIFDRRWALEMMDRGMHRLQAEYATDGRQELFLTLRERIGGGQDARFAAAATQLGMTEAAAKMAVQRMRRRYRELLSAEVRQTVECQSDVEAELRYLLELVSE